MAKLKHRVVTAADEALAQDKYVTPIGLLSALGWLHARQADVWRQGRVPHLEALAAVDGAKLAEAAGYLREWAEANELRPSDTSYVASTRDRRPLRFTANGDDTVERTFRTHWLSPELSERKREQLTERQNKAPDLVVIIAAREWSCADCGTHGEAGELMLPEDATALCLDCADFGHLLFLPAGDAALSRRAKKESTLCAVVLEFNRRRKRHERRGILVEQAALERAEQQCLADEQVRTRRRERDAVRRAAQDVEFQAAMAERIRSLYPGCPAERAAAIAEHAGTRGSGRVGRSAAGRALDERAVQLAVIASVRHLDTGYDELLMSGVPRDEARERIRADIDRVLAAWSAP